MSIRSNPRTVAPTATTDSAPRAPINFKDEFVNSTAALAASHEETVCHILSRLDQLQAKIQTQPEAGADNTLSNNSAPPRAAQRAASHVNVPTDQSVHARLASLESIHENALHLLTSKLDQVERQLSINKESESLMTQIASRLQQVEPRLQSHANMGDRVASLESRLKTQSDLHDRMNTLEVSARPDPEQERILARINAKLDIYDDQLRNRDNRRGSSALESRYEPERRQAEPSQQASSFNSRRSLDQGLSHRPNMEADMDKQERAKYLQGRIEKLKELRSRYEAADM